MEQRQPIMVDTALTASRFLGAVEVAREAQVLSVTGQRAAAPLFHGRETVGGILLIGGAAGLVVAATTSNGLFFIVAALMLLASAVVYLVAYYLLVRTARTTTVTFEQSAIQGLEVTTGPGWRAFLAWPFPVRGRAPRLSFNVVDDRFQPTPYEFVLENDEQLVELAALLARHEGRSQAGTVRVR